MNRIVCVCFLLTLPATGADFYGQAGYQWTASVNNGYIGAGAGGRVSKLLKIFGEFNFAPSASGTATATTNPGAGTSTVSVTGRAAIWDLDAGLKPAVAKRDNFEFYLLGSIGFDRVLAGSETVVAGTQGFTAATSGSKSGALVTFGGGLLFGSGRVRVGPEVRYLRYFGGFQANAVRIGIVLDVGR
jgi:hypothetical protein